MSERSGHEELYGLTGLGRSLERTLAAVLSTSEPLPAVELSLPPKPEFGDVSTPVALAAARLARRSPASWPASSASAGVPARAPASASATRWPDRGFSTCS